MAEQPTVQQGESVISLTPKAVEMVKQLRAKEGVPETQPLRIAVVGGGCSGFSYQLNFDGERQEGDQVVDYDGVQVVVDPTSAQYLAGTEPEGHPDLRLRIVVHGVTRPPGLRVE